MTRSWVIGEADERQRELYALVSASQRAGLDAVRAGLAAADLDAACRGVFVEAGYGDWFIHGTGHGVGLDIHEDPFLAAATTASLAPDTRGGFPCSEHVGSRSFFLSLCPSWGAR